MKFIPFDVDANLRETTQHGEEDFPVAVYLQQMNKNKEGFLILHWHDELQFVIPQDGEILYTVSNQPYQLSPGDVLFINSKCLHMAKPVNGSGSGSYICVDVHPQFLYGSYGSRINRNYVAPFLMSQEFSALLIDGSEPWHGKVKSLLLQVVTTYEAGEYAYELAVQKLLLEIWLLLVENNREKQEASTMLTQTEQLRMDCILAFIREHYAETITLSDIAASASISEGECCRFFKRTLDTSPMIYLNNFRILKSTSLLISSNLSITEVAHAVGFGGGSYYTERFKKMMNCKPLEYRKRFSSTQLSRAPLSDTGGSLQ